MKSRDRRIPATIAAVTVVLVVVCVLRPARHPGSSRLVASEGQFIGPGEGLARSFSADAEASPITLARFWYSKKFDDPTHYFKVWVNWGDPKHQDPTDVERGFWAHLSMDLDHSANGKWCYLVENWDPCNGARIAAPVYCESGYYVAYMKIWDAEKTALKPSICLRHGYLSAANFAGPDGQ